MHNFAFRFFIGAFSSLIPFACISAQERTVLFDSADVTITKMPCNTEWSDYAPAFCGDGLIFSSDRPHGFGVLTSDSVTPDNFYFLAENSGSVEFMNKVNTLQQEGTASYSSIDGVLYYSGTYQINNRNQLAIYARTRTAGGTWSTAMPIILPTDSFSYFQPCIIDNGNTLLFASDRSDGFGGTDLYRSVRQNGAWSDPVNLGPHINTTGNEGYPSYCAPGLLLFSSTAHGSIGGYDNFCCAYKGGIAGTIIPVGDKLNTSADDFGMIYDPQARIGYFTSNKDKLTGDDIYKFTLLWPQFSNCVAHVTPSYCYTFSEENSMAASDTALFYYQWSFGDGSTANALEADHCFAGPGIFNVELLIRDRKDTSFFMSQVIYEHEIAKKPGLRINSPDTVFVGDSVFVNADHSFLEGFSIVQYYWDCGDHFLIKRQQLVYVPAESGVQILQLGVMAHATYLMEDQSDTGHQFFCTEKNMVVLPAREKQASLRKQTGPRYSDPVKADGVPVFDLSQVEKPEYAIFLGTSKDSASFPRPGTDAIIRIIKEDTVYRYLYGSAEKMRAVYGTYMELKQLGIDSVFVIALSSDTIVSNQITAQRDFSFTETISNLIYDTLPAEAIIPVNLPAATPDTLVIYFKVNESTLNAHTKQQIDSLLNSQLNSPGTTFRLAAFSDQNGNDAYNLGLSKTRSRAVSSYLFTKGVKRGSVTQDAYGEERPREFRSLMNTLEHERCVVIIATPAPNK